MAALVTATRQGILVTVLFYGWGAFHYLLASFGLRLGVPLLPSVVLLGILVALASSFAHGLPWAFFWIADSRVTSGSSTSARIRSSNATPRRCGSSSSAARRSARAWPGERPMRSDR